MNYEYYYNNVPNIGKCRNNLIYTSLISEDKKVFVQWFHNDSGYHRGMNQVVDPALMDEKWNREVKYLQLMRGAFPELVPTILDIDFKSKKIYLEIDGDDFWERAGCLTENFDSVLPDWQSQMLEIVKAHCELGLYKLSMHPSSYFIVGNRLKSINYFFTYSNAEKAITINDFLSHVSENRRKELRKHTDALGISWDVPTPLNKLQELCFDSFSNNFPKSFTEAAKQFYA